MTIDRRAVVIGGGAAAAASLLGSNAEAVQVTLTPEHEGRCMITRGGQRIGPLEYDANGFGYGGDKHWRAPFGFARSYYPASGRKYTDEMSDLDIVGDWPA